MSWWVYSVQESQEKDRERNTNQRQEGNGEATNGQVGKNCGTETKYYADSRTAEHHDAGGLSIKSSCPDGQTSRKKHRLLLTGPTVHRNGSNLKVGRSRRGLSSQTPIECLRTLLTSKLGLSSRAGLSCLGSKYTYVAVRLRLWRLPALSPP